MRATTAALNDYIKTSSSPIMSTLDQQHPFMTNGNNELPLNHHHQQLQNNNNDPLHFDPSYWNMNDNVLDMAKLFDTSIWSMDPNASSSSSSSSNTTTPTHSFFDLSMKQTSYQSHPLIHPTHISHQQQQQQQQQQRWIQSLPTPIYNNNNNNNNNTNNSNNNISSSQSFIYNNNHSTNNTNNTMLPPSPPIESSSTPTIASPLTTTTTCSTTSSTSPLSHPTYMLHSMPLPLHDQQSYQQPMIMTTPFHPNMNSLSANHHSPPCSTSIQSNSPFIHPPPPSSSSILHQHHHHHQQQQQQKNNSKIYRRQSDQHPYRKNSNSNNNNPVRRRASSVASVVSLTAHEPVAHVINGIEHITFLYSHDRLVKEYTVRTDVQHVELDIIPMEFRLQNAIYPRANVEKEEYDGNRWNYETSCNELGWKLCWLNREQLYGKRGLIQRAVDSYRNRHAELRSRRVTRQEKVANGTLRKRRTKKALSNPFF